MLNDGSWADDTGEETTFLIMAVNDDDGHEGFLVLTTKEGQGPAGVINSLSQHGISVVWLIAVPLFPRDEEGI